MGSLDTECGITTFLLWCHRLYHDISKSWPIWIILKFVQTSILIQYRINILLFNGFIPVFIFRNITIVPCWYLRIAMSQCDPLKTAMSLCCFGPYVGNFVSYTIILYIWLHIALLVQTIYGTCGFQYKLCLICRFTFSKNGWSCDVELDQWQLHRQWAMHAHDTVDTNIMCEQPYINTYH